MLAHQRTRLLEQVVEVQDCSGPFEGGVVIEYFVELGRKLGDKRGREPTKNGPVAAIDPLKACGRLFIEERASLFARDTLPS